MADTTHPVQQRTAMAEPGFVRAIGLFDGTMIVVGSMIGSGIFIVAADIARQFWIEVIAIASFTGQLSWRLNLNAGRRQSAAGTC